MPIDPQVQKVQKWLNDTFEYHTQWNKVDQDGITGWQTIFALTRALQIELGITTLSDTFGPTTMSRLISQIGSITSSTSKKRIIAIAQGALWCKGYQGGYNLETFDAVTADAVQDLTTDMGLTPTTAVAPKVMKSLLSMDQFRLLFLNGGTPERREAQQWLNRTYSHRADFPLLACDGLYGRSVQQGLMFGIQYELDMVDGVANGNFGPGTKSGLRNNAVISQGAQDGSRRWVRIFQAALRFNGFTSDFNGTFTNTTANAARAFQQLAELPASGNGTYATWAGLLVSTGDETRSGTASDMSRPLTTAECNALYNAGYRTVGRYLSVLGKRIGPGELSRIHTAGLRVFPIMQEGNTSLADFSYAKGRDHGLQSVRRLQQLGFPAGTTVFYAVDFDANDEGITARVIPYFQGVNDIVKSARVKYTVGIYGTRNVCTRVIDASLANEAFLASMAWGWGGNLGFTMPAQWSYDQILEYTLAGTTLAIDKNVQSSRARPVNSDQLLKTPDQNAAEFDESYFWYLTDLFTRADIVLGSPGAPTGAVPWQSHADDFVLAYLQLLEPNYRGDPWTQYFLVFENAEVSAARTNFYTEASTVAPALASGTRNFSRLTHWAAALRGHTTWFLPAVNNAEAQVGELTGWAGDLINLWCQFVDYRASSGFVGSIADWFLAHIGSTATDERFGELDLICDVDAYLCYNRARPGYRPIADCVREIEVACKSDSSWRYRQFYAERFGASPGKAAKAAEHVFVSWFVGLSYPLSYFLRGRAAPTPAEAKQVGLGFEAALLSRI